MMTDEAVLLLAWARYSPHVVIFNALRIDFIGSNGSFLTCSNVVDHEAISQFLTLTFGLFPI